jgi:hypothetical protein
VYARMLVFSRRIYECCLTEVLEMLRMSEMSNCSLGESQCCDDTEMLRCWCSLGGGSARYGDFKRC